MITNSNLTICACWLIYIIYWIGSARRLKLVVERQSWLKQEESLMLLHFPNEYPAYRTRVKALVPFLI
jgi:protein-S-isoprenylcysteine O-methyltransferase Ste14